MGPPSLPVPSVGLAMVQTLRSGSRAKMAMRMGAFVHCRPLPQMKVLLHCWRRPTV